MITKLTPETCLVSKSVNPRYLQNLLRPVECWYWCWSVTVRDRDDAIWLITLEEVFSRPGSHTQSHNPPWGLRAALPGLGRIMLSWAGRRKIRILLKQNKSQLARCAPVTSQSIRFSQMIFVLLAFVSRNGDNNLPQLHIVFTGARARRVCPQFSALRVTLTLCQVTVAAATAVKYFWQKMS